MKIIIETIGQDAQRYETMGDWFYDEDGTLQIKVSESVWVGDTGKFLIAIHELVEAWLCRERGITQEQVDEWDCKMHNPDGEPGDMHGCPYGKEHRFAMLIEHLIAHELGLKDYGVVR